MKQVCAVEIVEEIPKSSAGRILRRVRRRRLADVACASRLAGEPIYSRVSCPNRDLCTIAMSAGAKRPRHPAGLALTRLADTADRQARLKARVVLERFR
jgi:hypothetical protein